jgi:hypothetical protein
MAITSVYDEAINQVRSDIQFARLRPAQVKVGHEEVNKRDARARFMDMSPEERREAIKENGEEKTMDMLRPQGGLSSFRDPEELGSGAGAPQPPQPPQQPQLPLAPPQQGMTF